MRKVDNFDKYDFYQRSVQSPELDVAFLKDSYKELRGKTPKSLREDFCGTHLVCCEWVKLNKNNVAIGIDLDSEPLDYGQEYYWSKLSRAQKARAKVEKKNVLSSGLPKSDIVAALNFSYFIFKERTTLKSYFKNVYKSLNEGGILVLDCFGGSQCQEANEEETEHDDFSYYWDQDSFDPVSNHGQFYIHFKKKGERKRKKVFSYDWRMWSVPELRDVMQEVGFKSSYVYWEGTTEDGEGDGEFSRVEVGEDCEAWIAYVVAAK